MKKEKRSFELVVPIYNEEAELAKHVEILWKFCAKTFADRLWRIRIVDNASTDKSLTIAQELEKKFSEVAVLHLDEKGRGRAVRTAWLTSSYEFVGYTDVDLSTDLGSLVPMLDSLENGFDIAIASRLLSTSKVQKRSMLREIISRLYNVLLKLVFQVRFSDAQCGFKILRKDIFIKLEKFVKNQEWFFDTEMLIIAQKAGLKIYEHPVVWRDNPGSTVRVLPTIIEDMRGVVRLFLIRPWRRV